MKSERELFEAWAYSKKWNIFRVRDMGIDRYVDDFVDGAWSGWQASAQRQGYKLVPVETTAKQNREGVKKFVRHRNENTWACDAIDDIYKAMIEAVD